MDTKGNIHFFEDSDRIPPDFTEITDLEAERLGEIPRDERHAMLKDMRKAEKMWAEKEISKMKARLGSSAAERRKKGKKRN